MDEMRCPHCHSTNIKNDDVFDISATICDLTEHCYGHCKTCGAEIMYNRVYIFSHYEDIKLVED